MRCMTVRKSCHGVCNLEACFWGTISMVGGNYARCPPDVMEISCLSHQNWWKYTFKKNEAAQRSLTCPSP